MSDYDSTSLDNLAVGIAQQFKMDAHDIRDAYEAKPESLRAHFNVVSEAREDRGWYVGLGIFWTLACFPVVAYPVWKLAEKYLDLNAVRETVREEVRIHKETGGKCCAPRPEA